MTSFGHADISAAFMRVSERLSAEVDTLTALDQAMGDGDLGVTAQKIATVLVEAANTRPDCTPGKRLADTGMAINRVAASTMGTLVATALMRAGMSVKDKDALGLEDLVAMFDTAEKGVRDRGKAALGDKTMVDALHPAATAFRDTIGTGLSSAAGAMVEAARTGAQSVIPLRSRLGRAGWVGERTQGKPDPGCVATVAVLEALSGQ